MNLEVGQKLWCVNNSGGRADAGREVVVEKVGRKWAVLSNGYRMDIETGGLDGGQYKSPGRCYVSRGEAYEAELARRKAWDELRDTVSRVWSAPAHLTASDIHAIILRIKGN